MSNLAALPTRRPAPAFTPTIEVLIVDDSAVTRAALARIIDDAPALHLVGAVHSAEHAVAWLTDNRVDVVLLDLSMPGRGGLAALPDIIAAGQGSRVLIVAAAVGRGARAMVDALALGASDTIAKPPSMTITRDFGRDLVARIERIGKASRKAANAVPIGLRATAAGSIGVLAIGSSTGGIEALSTFFDALPASFVAPILVTQHLPRSFMPYLAEQLAAVSKRTASVAVDGERLRAGHVFVAPGHAHLRVSGMAGYARVSLTDGVATTRCRPSVDPMLASLAPMGGGATGILLSGMGCDGLEGAHALVAAGGAVLAQDEASSAVWGMPGVVARAGLATLVADPATLAEHVGVRGSR